jgi:outer membrane protein OmpA-like peptidoglycan-associated protein
MVVLPALVLGYPGIGGGKGLLRMQNALVEDEAGLTISLHGLGRNPLFLVPSDARYTKGWVLDLVAPELSYAPVVTKYAALELFTSWGGVFQTPKTADGGGFTMSTHDLKAGGKVSIPILPVLKLGFTGNYTFMTGRGDLSGGVTWLDPDALPIAGGPAGSSKFAWAGLATIQLQDILPTAPNFMLNYGKINDETRYGLGVEFAGRGFSLFGEALSRQPMGSAGMFDTDTGHFYLTPGVVFGNVSSFSWKVAYSFVLGHRANNELILGVSLATPFGARPKPQYGTITGTVTDEKTGAAITADINFPKDDAITAFTTDATGVFEVKKVKTGVAVVEASAPGYQSETAPLDVTKDKVTTHDFKLRSLVAYGVVAGTVLDAVTKKPLNARVEFPNSSIAAVNSDQPGGAFRVNDVPTGVYSVTAALAGYFTGSQTVTVEDGKVVSADFTLKSSSVSGSLSGTVTDAATKKPLKAEVSFADPNLSSLTTDKLTGFYSVAKLPAGPTVVKVSAEGYFGAQATAVIVANGATVQDFALKTSAAQTGLVSGVVTDMQTKAPLAATVSFPGTSIPSVQSDSTTGLYKATVPLGPLVVACALTGYVTQMSPSPVVIQANVPAVYNFQMLKIGTEITLSNDAIHFDFNSAEIQPAGYPALDEWVKLMKNNPFMTAEIQGHTDAVGSASYNQDLSERRAASVVSYLTGQGIERSRLTSVGYGESRLVVQTQEKNETNRRVIFRVVGEKK